LSLIENVIDVNYAKFANWIQRPGTQAEEVFDEITLNPHDQYHLNGV